ncbi:hypothetical protein BMS3Bbin01_00836 [bacterium BMS3Bbin01]|nr:hypothetical protein BMS3Bbin01_00836 [bacterium BMS3Bbin01]
MVGALDFEMESPRSPHLTDWVGINPAFTGSIGSTVPMRSVESCVPHHRPLAAVMRRIHVCRADLGVRNYGWSRQLGWTVTIHSFDSYINVRTRLRSPSENVTWATYGEIS